MRLKLTFLIFTCVFLFPCSSYCQSNLLVGNTTVQLDTIKTGLNVPWEMIYGPDGHLWITERSGLVSRINPVTKTKTVILDITTNVFVFAEAGLLGLALHPDFPTLPEVFLVYTYGVTLDIKERLVKYTYNNGQLINPQILLDSIKGNVAHNGSRLLFLPDKTLLMTTGEAQNSSLSQNLNSRNGKILRLKTDGSIPTDNPFPGSYVYCSGLRNAQGLAYGPNGNIYISDHGPVNNDEFQLLEKGRNYGWPDVEGFCNTTTEISYCQANNIKEPLLTWSPAIAVCDLHWYHNPSFPEFDQRLLMTTLKTKKIVAIKLDVTGTSTVSEQSYLSNMFGRLRAICKGPQKEIYLATNGAAAGNSDAGTHSILVLRPPLPTGLSSVNKNNFFKVYPTVVESSFNVQSASDVDCVLRVLDINGNLCLRTIISEGNNKIEFRNYSEGVYFLIVQDVNKEIVFRTRIVKLLTNY